MLRFLPHISSVFWEEIDNTFGSYNIYIYVKPDNIETSSYHKPHRTRNKNKLLKKNHTKKCDQNLLIVIPIGIRKNI